MPKIAPFFFGPVTFSKAHHFGYPCDFSGLYPKQPPTYINNHLYITGIPIMGYKKHYNKGIPISFPTYPKQPRGFFFTAQVCDLANRQLLFLARKVLGIHPKFTASDVPWSRLSRFVGDGRPPTFNRNPYNGYINPYYWVDEFISYYMEIMGVGRPWHIRKVCRVCIGFSRYKWWGDEHEHEH